MKIISPIRPLILLFLSSYLLSGQCLFYLANRYGPSAHSLVYDANEDPLSGSSYLAELWGAGTPDLLNPAISYETGNRVFAPFVSPGYFVYGGAGASASIVGLQLSSWAWLQVRVWDVRLGATYEDAVQRGLGGYGESPLLYAEGGAPSPNGNYLADLIGLQSFSLRAATAVLIQGIRREGDEVVVVWYPGFKRYQLQQTVALGQSWVNVGEPTSDTSATNTISGNVAFFRVLGLVE